MIVTDAQVHVWPAETPDRPWPDERRQYAHRPHYTIDELRADMAVAGVDRAILVPPLSEGDRNDYCLQAAADHPGVFRVMGRLDVADRASRGLVPRWLEQPGMLGIRVTFSKNPPASWLEDGTADWLWSAAEVAGIPIMVFSPFNIPHIGRIAARYPDLRIVVDHLGFATGLTDDLGPSIERLIRLAHLPNVAVKASSLPAYITELYPFRTLHDHIERVVDAFGPRRVFWGSDVTRLPCSYGEARRLFTEELDFLDAESLEWIMGRGLSEWIGWK
ncbi:amidohydrolase family protein [Rhodococcus aetherivorans]|uniref:amidohydrolase family protein n=1 Tax=Rhodococcus aetherivorans TaxID=191292 RepID=UPI00364DFFDA